MAITMVVTSAARTMNNIMSMTIGAGEEYTIVVVCSIVLPFYWFGFNLL